MILDRTQAPPFSLSTDYSLLQPEIVTLSKGQSLYTFNGLQQEAIKLDLIFRAGKWYEPASGVSHFTAHMLRRGTTKRSAAAIAEGFERLGAHLEVTAGFDTITVSLYVLHKNLDEAACLLMEVLSVPTFPDEELRLEKEIFVQNLKVNNEKTSVLASREIRKTLFGPHHPYGNSTEEADVTAITTESLRRYFQSHLHLHSAYLVGPVNDADLDRLERIFDFPAATELSQQTPELISGHSHAVLKPGSVQASIRLGKLCIRKQDTKEYYAAVMANHVLGGFFGSRLMKNIREEKGLTYGIYSVMQHHQHGSYWVVSAEVNQHNTDQAIEEIRKEIVRLQQEPVSPDELVVARNYFIGSWQSDNATLFAVAEKIRNIREFNLPADYYNRMFSYLTTMTPKDLQEAMRSQFLPQDLLEIRVG